MNQVAYETPKAEILEVAAEDILNASANGGTTKPGGGAIQTPEDDF